MVWFNLTCSVLLRMWHHAVHIKLNIISRLSCSDWCMPGVTSGGRICSLFCKHLTSVHGLHLEVHISFLCTLIVVNAPWLIISYRTLISVLLCTWPMFVCKCTMSHVDSYCYMFSILCWNPYTTIDFRFMDGYVSSSFFYKHLYFKIPN